MSNGGGADNVVHILCSMFLFVLFFYEYFSVSLLKEYIHKNELTGVVESIKWRQK